MVDVDMVGTCTSKPQAKHALIRHSRHTRRSAWAAASSLLLLLLLSVAACQPDRTVPTVASIEGLSTEAFLTEQAPPPAYHKVAFERIDANLSLLPAWHHRVTLEFEGTTTATASQPATPLTGMISADVYANELRGEKRVVLNVAGAAFNADPQGSTVEGVRIGNDYYVVNPNKICTVAKDAANRRITELTASALIGGVKQATFTYNQREINARRAWEYAFTPGNVVPPIVELREGSSMTIASGTLWIAPSTNAVAEYRITFNITNVSIQGSPPLDGVVRVFYELKETGDMFNISIPFGC